MDAVTDKQSMGGSPHQRLSWLVAAVVTACGGAPIESAAGPATPSADDHEAWAKAQGLVYKPFDLNRDGKPDVMKFYRLVPDPKNLGNELETIVRRDTDLNHDGKFDVRRLYDDEGRVTEERTDLDFDGRYDQVAYFKAGAIDKKTLDLNYDEKVDLTKFYEAGKLARVEADRNNDGKIDTWEYYEAGELDRIGVDTNADGEVDQWEKKRQATATPDDAGVAPTATEAPGGSS
jgi:hypothetical protein